MVWLILLVITVLSIITLQGVVINQKRKLSLRDDMETQRLLYESIQRDFDLRSELYKLYSYEFKLKGEEE